MSGFAKAWLMLAGTMLGCAAFLSLIAVAFMLWSFWALPVAFLIIATVGAYVLRNEL